MLIKEGTLLSVDHSRKGEFTAVAKRDFDTEEEFYPIVLVAGKPNKLGGGIEGLLGVSAGKYEWENGEEIPCRKSLCKIEIMKKKVGD